MMKKQLIMEKSLELFAKQGFDATSVQQITEHCGISKGAFYLSFKSKHELILALIDFFMMEIVSDIDRVVRGGEKEKLLFEFYQVIFGSFSKHSNYAKIFIKEQTHFINDDFITKMHHYNHLIETSILTMIERLYGEKVADIKYDLVYCIQGFMKTYSELFFFHNFPLDLETLCRSLEERTNLLAAYSTIPFITGDLVQLIRKPESDETSTDELVQLLDRHIDEMSDSIEKESLELLKEELSAPSLGRAVINGLLENIKHHPKCKWTEYRLRNYFQLS
ncbi:TetR/AcrR family transcriptional regulator [Oceanobacillus massiliensis]|uniref:TetR/AcrR family transcriptional regulator n=1 Tax=Oceanobacillus massiliensis TaxID=1465765 RepID=UPI000287C31E|nr:TetR/AcrR family transcriptional regulator [Oceanobacillus massiliensis]